MSGSLGIIVAFWGGVDNGRTFVCNCYIVKLEIIVEILKVGNW